MTLKPVSYTHLDVYKRQERLRALRPGVYPNEKYPNFTDSRAYRNIYDFVTNTVNIDRLYPRVGDVGSYPKYSLASKITWNSASARCIEHAYEIFQHPKFAWALANAPGWNPSEQFPYTREQIEAAAVSYTHLDVYKRQIQNRSIH